jgi:hypothetical protein
MMRKFMFFALFCIALLIPSVVMAASYYVTQNGSGSRNGLNKSNAWSVSDFNKSTNWSSTSDPNKISPGDTVFFSGTITSQVTPAGSGSASGGYITLDGYEEGTCNHMSGADTKGALINVSGGYGIRLYGNKYLNIQDFRINNCSTAIVSSATKAIHTLNNIVIRRISMDGNGNGVYLTSNSRSYLAGTYITIEDCEIVDTAKGSSSSSLSALRLAVLNDVVIRRNHIYSRPSFTLLKGGADGIVMVLSNKVLIEYNRIHRMAEDGIDFKSLGGDVDFPYGGVIIRFNIIYDMPHQTGITMQHEAGSNAYVYGNLIHGPINWYPILVQRGFKNVFIWSNLIYNTRKAGIAVFDQDPARPVDTVHSFNNTVVDTGKEGDIKYDAGIRYDSAITKHTIKNNIFVNNNVGAKTQISAAGSAGDRTTSNYNIFWIAESTAPKIFQGTTVYTLSNPVSSSSYCLKTGQDKNSSIGNPYFIDKGKYDLRLTEKSLLAIGTGENLSSPPSGWNPPTIQGVNYSSKLSLAIGLDPDNTDWSQTPPKVNTINRNDIGSWDKGAYVFKKNSTVTSIAPPKIMSVEPAPDSK